MDAAGGRFDELEAWSTAHELAFDRYSETCVECNGECVRYRHDMARLHRVLVRQDEEPALTRSQLQEVREALLAGSAGDALQLLDYLLGNGVEPLPPLELEEAADVQS